jgi:hypothetical protein
MTLHHASIGHAPVLDNAEVAVFLAVLLPNRPAQKHAAELAAAQPAENRVGLHYSRFWPRVRIPPLARQGLGARRFSKCSSNPRSWASVAT